MNLMNIPHHPLSVSVSVSVSLSLSVPEGVSSVVCCQVSQWGQQIQVIHTTLSNLRLLLLKTVNFIKLYEFKGLKNYD